MASAPFLDQFRGGCLQTFVKFVKYWRKNVTTHTEVCYNTSNMANSFCIFLYDTERQAPRLPQERRRAGFQATVT